MGAQTCCSSQVTVRIQSAATKLSGVPSTVCGVTETPGTRTAQPIGPDAVPDRAPDPVPVDVPRRLALSPSRAADFKQCPLLYRFRAIDRLPEVPSPAQVRGTLVHAVLDRLYALPAAQRVPAAARALVAPVWEQLCEADPALATALFGGDGTPAQPMSAEAAPAVTPSASGTDAAAWMAGVDPLLDAYFALEDPRRLEPEARELLVEVELESGLLLRGYVDRVDRVDGVGPGAVATSTPGPTVDDPATGDTPADAPPASACGGGYRVVDYKTGTAPGPTTEARALFQMKFYALVLLLLRGRAPAELRLMYLTGPEALHYVPDEAQLLRFGRTLDAMWVAIRAAGATGDFRPNPGPACAWCCHRALCPAWDGVPPPYPGWPADSGTDATTGAATVDTAVGTEPEQPGAP
jgi:putative RecB family exonuclease